MTEKQPPQWGNGRHTIEPELHDPRDAVTATNRQAIQAALAEHKNADVLGRAVFDLLPRPVRGVTWWKDILVQAHEELEERNIAWTGLKAVERAPLTSWYLLEARWRLYRAGGSLVPPRWRVRWAGRWLLGDPDHAEEVARVVLDEDDYEAWGARRG